MENSINHISVTYYAGRFSALRLGGDMTAEEGFILLNGISKIDSSKGDYIVLVDYGHEGIDVKSQHHDIQEAVSACCDCSGGSQTLVQLPRFNSVKPTEKGESDG